MMLSVAWDVDAQEELRRLPSAERRAVMTAVAKLEAFGDQLGAPHSSQVKGSPAGIRELRPRAGRSPWRGAVPAAGRDDGDSGCRAGGRA
jgi:phage-related protein